MYEQWINRRYGFGFGVWCFLFPLLMGVFSARGGVSENAVLISQTVTNGTPVMPRTMFTQTWTLQNTGTTNWSPGSSGCTLNLVGADSLGAMTLFTNSSGSWYTPSAIIGSGHTIAPGQSAAFSLNFYTPETAGTYTDTFQLNDLGGTNFGPQVTLQVVVKQSGSTNEYDRGRAISYANNYAGYVCSDGYFWTNGSSYGTFTPGSPAPPSGLGDDCAHFVSSCIGRQSAGHWGGGIYIPSRATPTYGEPGAARLLDNCLLGPGYAVEVSSLNQLSPGDVIGWNWEGNTSISNIDHVTFYLGNGMLAAHSGSALEVSALTWYQSSLPNWRWHLIHILDTPLMTNSIVGKHLVFSWGTNWVTYAAYSSTSLATNATWTKVSTAPTRIGATYFLTNTVAPTGSVYYRLMTAY